MQDWLTLHQSATATYAGHWFSETNAWFGTDKDGFKNQFLQSGAADLTLHISSPGGDADDVFTVVAPGASLK